ncbi:MAG: O-antigen ligase-related protein [Hyphomicrobiales bacterium]|nr:O-antigen ligase-related protein [Hyphomicrobiales bacterium]
MHPDQLEIDKMSDTAPPIHIETRGGASRFNARTRPKYAISRSAFSDGLLYFLAYFCLIRATGMWIGYPPTQDENATVDSGPQQLLLYSLIPFTLLYVWLNSKLVFGYIRRIPLTLAIFMVLVLISTAVSVNFVASARGLMAVVVISLPILLFKNRFGSVKTIDMLRNFAVVAVFANLLYTAILPRYGVMGGSLAGSVRGLFLHKNFFGQFSALAFLLLVPTLTQRPLFTYKNLRIAAACVLALGSAALSKSSTALVLCLVGLASLGVSWLISQVPMKSLRIYVLLVSVTVLAAFVYFFGLAFAGDIASSFGKDITLSGRSELWDALLDALFERPWFGHGFAMFRQPDYIAMFTHQIAWGPRSTHNTYLELALNLGIPAIAMWVIFLLARFVSKAVYVPASPIERMANSREVAVMMMVIIGSFTEAGMMLAPLATWPLLLAVLPETRIKRPLRPKQGAGHSEQPARTRAIQHT